MDGDGLTNNGVWTGLAPDCRRKSLLRNHTISMSEIRMYMVLEQLLRIILGSFIITFYPTVKICPYIIHVFVHTCSYRIKQYAICIFVCEYRNCVSTTAFNQ